MLDFIANNFNVLLITANNCRGIIGNDTYDILHEIYTIFRIVVPILVVLLITVDLVKATAAQDDNAIKKAQSDALKRVLIGVAVFFVPTVLDLIFDMVSIAIGTCQLGV